MTLQIQAPTGEWQTLTFNGVTVTNPYATRHRAWAFTGALSDWNSPEDGAYDEEPDA